VSSIHVDRARQESASKSERSQSDLSATLRVLGATLRVAFIVCLLVVTVRVSMPQNETIWTAYDTPADLVRLALGFAVCLWLAFQLFRAPKDAHSYRMWTYFGLIGVPFAVICLMATW
jgi:FtsH-binding integral membrane protein